MMPTPVKNGLVAAGPSPAKAAQAAAPQGATGDSFRDELVRRRRTESAGKSEHVEKSEAAQKAEARRPARSKKPVRPGRGEPVTPEAAEIRASPAGEGDAQSAPPVGDDAVTGESQVAAGDVDANESAGTRVREAAVFDTSGSPAAVAAVAAQVPVIERANAAAANPEKAEGAEDSVGAARVVESRPADAVVYHGIDAPAVDQAGAEEGDETPAPATTDGGLSALFTSDSADEGERDAASDDSGDAPRGNAGAVELADIPVADDGASMAEFPSHPTSGDPPAHPSADAGTLGATAAAGLAEALPETRPVVAPSSAGPVAPSLPPEVRFAAANHENIVTSMRGELMPNGGSMRIRLDPPHLGALQVTVQIQDGLITASFETSNDEATRLLGHSLNQLKGVLESHGVAVDKLQVLQAPRDAQASNPNDDGRREQGGQSHEQEQSARQEQQRREMLRRMWRRLSGGQDPLDLTA